MADEVFDDIDLIAPDRGFEELLAGGHPVAVALDGVDLAIVAHHAEGLAERPCGEGVGGETLVVEADRGLEIRVAEIVVERAQGGGHGERLVGDEAVGKGRHVKAVDLLGCVLDFAPAEVELPLEFQFLHPLGAEHEKVLDLRAGLLGDLAEGIDVHRDIAPADRGDAALGDGLCSDLLDRCGLRVVSCREEENPYGDVSGIGDLGSEFFRRLGEKGEGDLG